jgi:hypothetical protein
MDERLKEFLDVASTANWRHVPKVWNPQFREALSGSFVKVGWGGVVQLTVLGEMARRGDELPALGQGGKEP